MKHQRKQILLRWDLLQAYMFVWKPSNLVAVQLHSWSGWFCWTPQKEVAANLCVLVVTNLAPASHVEHFVAENCHNPKGPIVGLMQQDWYCIGDFFRHCTSCEGPTGWYWFDWWVVCQSSEFNSNFYSDGRTPKTSTWLDDVGMWVLE